MCPFAQRRADEDRAVEKAQVFFKGMSNRPAGHYHPLYGHTLLDEHAKVLRSTGHPNLIGLHVSVKRTPKSDVVAHFAQSWHLHNLIQSQYKRRDIVKIDALYPGLGHAGVGCHQSRWGVYFYSGFGGGHWQQAGLQRHGGDADNAVAAHSAEALVMHEENADVSLCCDRRGDDAPVHVRVPSRFPHEGRPQVI